jgi:arylsulfatase A-like enzyme
MSAPINVLIIYTDQHRWDCYGAGGNDQVRTPNLDRIANEGVRYDNCFCALPVCTPSRYSFLTGMHVREHSGWSNHSTLPAHLATFPKLLARAGYRTAAVGKMHFTPTYLDVGFQQMRLAEQAGPGRWDDDYHRYLNRHGLVDRIDMMDQREELRIATTPPPWDCLLEGTFTATAPSEYWQCFGAMTSNLADRHHSTTWIAQQALEAIDQWEGGGHLLMASFIKPHHPFDPPAPWDVMYDPQDLALRPGWLEEPLAGDSRYYEGFFDNRRLDESALKQIMARYYGSISHIDQQVGRLLECLEDKKLYDRTLILFTSDHGEYLGFHHMLLKGGLMYDPLVRIPLAVKYPGRSSGGDIHAGFFSNIDCAASLLRVAGLEPAETMNQSAGLDGKGRDLIFAEKEDGRSVMVRTATHKLLHDVQAESCRLFDLQNDPLELYNQYGRSEYADVQCELQGALLQWAGHDALAPQQVCEDQPIIDQPNARRPGDGHRERLYREMVERYMS